MKRLGAIALFAGAVLLSTHILAPAEPPPPPPELNPADLAAIVQVRPVVEQVNQQVDRLRERLANPPTYPPPTRDPFRFGERAEPARPKTAQAPAAPAPPVKSAPVLPHLIAIATNAQEGDAVRTAVLALGDDLQIVKAGETYSKFLVGSIGADAVELSDPLTGSTFKLSLQ
jgi:hypothetical protein